MSYDNRATNNYLNISMNNIDLFEKHHNSIEDNYENGTPHEKAEFIYQKAKCLTLKGERKSDIELYKEAHELKPNIQKYHLSYIDSLVFDKYDDKKFCKRIIS